MDADEETVARTLRECSTWAVVGLGGDPGRAAYGVAAFLQRHGKRIVPVHPTATEVLGEPAYPTLAAVPFALDCVDVFRRSSAAGAVWFQLGVIDEAAAGRVRRAGLDMVMDRCPKIEWGRLGPRAA